MENSVPKFYVKTDTKEKGGTTTTCITKVISSPFSSFQNSLDDSYLKKFLTVKKLMSRSTNFFSSKKASIVQAIENLLA